MVSYIVFGVNHEINPTTWLTTSLGTDSIVTASNGMMTCFAGTPNGEASRQFNYCEVSNIDRDKMVYVD